MRIKKKSGSESAKVDSIEQLTNEFDSLVLSEKEPVVEVKEDVVPDIQKSLINSAEIGSQWSNVVETSIRIDNPNALAERLRSELTLGEKRKSIACLMDALDNSADNYSQSCMLYRSAKNQESLYMQQYNDRFEIMSSVALSELMQEYKEKKRRSPTNEDIRGRIMRNWNDEFRRLESRKNELHNAVRSLEGLMNAWKIRCSILKTMVENFNVELERVG